MNRAEKRIAEARRAYRRKWYETHKEERHAYMKQWRKNNPDKCREYEQRHWNKVADEMEAAANDAG